MRVTILKRCVQLLSEIPKYTWYGHTDYERGENGSIGFAGTLPVDDNYEEKKINRIGFRNNV